MLDTIVDPDVQRRLGLKSFFESHGYQVFKSELDDAVLGADDSIDCLSKNKIEFTQLGDLNFRLGVKTGLSRVLYILEALQDELRENSSVADVNS